MPKENKVHVYGLTFLSVDNKNQEYCFIYANFKYLSLSRNGFGPKPLYGLLGSKIHLYKMIIEIVTGPI